MPATTVRIRLTKEKLIATAHDDAGGLVVEASSPIEARAPEPGWLEQRPEEWWDALAAAVASLRTNTSLTAVTTFTIASDVAAAVFLDGEREVIRPAILDGDVRGPYPIAWLRRHQPIAYKRVQHLLQPADYLRMTLTGEIATTPADAQRTGLLDAATGAWDTRQCDALEINVELLPPIRVARRAILDAVGMQLDMTGSVVE